MSRKEALALAHPDEPRGFAKFMDLVSNCLSWADDRIAKAMGVCTARFSPHFRCLHDAVMAAPHGALVECGVYRGATLMGMARLRPGSLVYGLDWFNGLPDPSEHDAAGCRAGMFQSDVARLRNRIRTAGFRNVRIIEGLFSSTLWSVEGPIAVLHLDCDLYEPHVECLNALLPKMASGGIVVLDDYNHELFGHGVRKAVGECAPWATVRVGAGRAAWFVCP